MEAEIAGKERLGGNIGVYCVTVTFVGENNEIEDCRSDLEDGDRRTLRYTSKTALAAGSEVDFSVNVDRVGSRRVLVAPP